MGGDGVGVPVVAVVPVPSLLIGAGVLLVAEGVVIGVVHGNKCPPKVETSQHPIGNKLPPPTPSGAPRVNNLPRQMEDHQCQQPHEMEQLGPEQAAEMLAEALKKLVEMEDED